MKTGKATRGYERMFERMDDDGGGEIDRAEFRDFWHRLPPGVFTEVPVFANGRDFFYALVRSPLATVAHLRLYLDMIVDQGVAEFRASLLAGTMEMIEHGICHAFFCNLYLFEISSVLKSENCRRPAGLPGLPV